VVADDAGVMVSGAYSGSLQGFPARLQANLPAGFVVEIGAGGEVGHFQVLSPTTADSSGAPLLALSGGNLLLAGAFQGDLTSAGATLQSEGGRDAFVSRAPR